MKDPGTLPVSATTISPGKQLLRQLRTRPAGLPKEFTREMYYSALREIRGSLENPQTPLSYPAEWLLDIFNGGRTDSGLRVSEMTALQVSTVCACVNIIGNGVASLPLNVVEKLKIDNRTAKRVADDHYLYDLLHSEPNIEMTSVTWRRTFMAHICLWGNAYTEIQRDNSNRITALWPRNPGRTRPVRLTTGLSWEGDFYPPGTLCYETYDNMGDAQVWDTDGPDNRIGVRRLVLAEDMIHVPGLSLDGRLGQDVVHLGRQAIGLSLATEKYAAKFFGNGAIPAGVLSVPGDMTEVQWEVLKRSWAESHGGENSHKTGVLPPGVTYTKAGASPAEGQMLESRDYQRAEVASIFGVPGHMVGAAEKSAGKSNVEQSSIEFLLYCLGPHLNAFEHELKRKLFPKVGQNAGKYHVKFDTHQLLYPDATSRTAFYSGGKQNGYLTTNDIHEMEGMNPVDDGSGDVYWMPVNMQDAAMAAKSSDQASDAMDDGTLQTVPPNTLPIGQHPVAQHNAKVAKVAAGAQIAAAAASRPRTTANGTSPSSPGSGGPGGGHGKQSAAKTSGNREAIAFTEKAYGPMFQDAVHRAIFRKKANAADYATIFGPLLATLADVLEIVMPPDAIQQYISEAFERGKQWKAEDAASIGKIECTTMTELVMRNAQDDPALEHTKLADQHFIAAREAGDVETAEGHSKAALAHLKARDTLQKHGKDSAAYQTDRDAAHAATAAANS